MGLGMHRAPTQGARRTVAAGALAVGFIVGASGVASASYVASTVGDGGQSHVPGAVETFTGPGVDEESKTDFGANHIYIGSTGSTGSAASEYQVDFTLSGAAVLLIHYRYDVSITGGSFNYQIDTTPVFHALYVSATTNISSGSNNDFCADRAPGAHPDGFCAGTHAADGVISVAFAGGANAIYAGLFGSAGVDGTVDGLNTGEITEIEVPDGVTWTYSDLPGNPLDFRYAAVTGVAEPGTLALLAFGIVLLGAGRCARPAGDWIGLRRHCPASRG